VDAVDEAFARAWARWGRVQRMGNPVGWVYRVARNKAIRTHRRRAREAGGDPPDTGWQPPVADLDLWARVRELPERQREAVALHYVAGLTQAEVARAMRVRPGTIAATLNHARAALKTSLGEEYAR
jgi:RNA polymerase sigma-70 factor, ECF subfamily